MDINGYTMGRSISLSPSVIVLLNGIKARLILYIPAELDVPPEVELLSEEHSRIIEEYNSRPNKFLLLYRTNDVDEKKVQDFEERIEGIKNEYGVVTWKRHELSAEFQENLARDRVILRSFISDSLEKEFPIVDFLKLFLALQKKGIDIEIPALLE